MFKLIRKQLPHLQSLTLPAHLHSLFFRELLNDQKIEVKDLDNKRKLFNKALQEHLPQNLSHFVVSSKLEQIEVSSDLYLNILIDSLLQVLSRCHSVSVLPNSLSHFELLPHLQRIPAGQLNALQIAFNEAFKTEHCLEVFTVLKKLSLNSLDLTGSHWELFQDASVFLATLNDIPIISQRP